MASVRMAQTSLTSRIKHYIAASRQMMSELSERLDLDLAGSSGVIVGGSGNLQ